MLTPLKINYNIIPEDVIRQYQINKPRTISAHIFESVVAELITKNKELKEIVEKLEFELENSYTQDQLDEEIRTIKDQLDDKETELENLDNELTKLKTDLATYLSNYSDALLVEVQPYFKKQDLEKLIDDYAE